MHSEDPRYGFYAHIPISYEPRPDLSMAWEKKDEKYDLGVARHCLGGLISSYVDFQRSAAITNEGFASGRIWGRKQAYETYLMDKGQNTSRPALQFPLFTPMLSRMLGLLSQAEVHGRAESMSPRAESRKEMYMNQVLAYSVAANSGPMMAQVYTSMGITGDEDQDALMADRSFRDELVEHIGVFTNTMAKRMKVEQIKYELGQNLSTGGVAALHAYFRSGYPCIEPISPMELLTDPSSVRRDLSDSGFIGMRKHRDLSDLMEMHNGKRELLRAIEESMKSKDERGPGGDWPWGKPLEYTVYFKDGEYVTKGFVDGPYGLDMVVVGKDDQATGKPKYTEEDLVDPPDNYWTKDWTGKTCTKFVSRLRYCTFLPREYNPAGIKDNNGNELNDIVLSSGECEDVEASPEQEEGVPFPIFRCSWMNISGMLVAPLTAAQTPQEVMNIISSDVVHRIARAGGRSPVFDKRALAGQSVAKVGMDLKSGDPIELDSTNAGSVGNAIGYAGEGIDDNVFKEFELIDRFKTISESLTHLYDQNFGAQGSANELVGVKRLQWQQVSLAQQPYTEALRITFQQLYNWLGNTARRRMLKTPWLLERVIGEKGTKAFMAMADAQMEEVKIEVKLSPDAATVRQAVDETVMMQYLPAQLVDPATAAEILGVSTPEEAIQIVKKFNKGRQIAAAKQAEAEAEAAQMHMFKEEDDKLRQEEADLHAKGVDASIKADQINAKSEMPINAAIAKHLEPETEAGTMG